MHLFHFFDNFKNFENFEWSCNQLLCVGTFLIIRFIFIGYDCNSNWYRVCFIEHSYNWVWSKDLDEWDQGSPWEVICGHMNGSI